MTAPLRTSLLNWQIAHRARELAHEATATCKGALMPNENDNHTPNCNALKKQIEEFALQIKFASIQPSRRS